MADVDSTVAEGHGVKLWQVSFVWMYIFLLKTGTSPLCRVVTAEKLGQ